MERVMTDLKTALFDFDGVLVDTEPIYDIFWNEAGARYETGIADFARVIKGQTLAAIIKTYMSGRSEAFCRRVYAESAEYERTMPLPPMRGSIEFVRMLKANGVKLGLVTSSDNVKVERAFRELGLDGLFDSVVTADRIVEGKPDPSCYLLAAKDLGVSPGQCLVFEDSFAGVKSGTDAGMRVIALATTNPARSFEGKAYKVIPDFLGLGYADYLSWCAD